MSQEKQNLHDTAALRALAMGEVILEDSEKNEEESEFIADSRSADASYKVLAGTDGKYVSESKLPKSPTTSVNPPSRNTPADGGTTNSRGGGKRISNRQNYHVGIQFRKTIIPLLLLMAIILVAVGVFTLVKVKNSSPEVISNNPFLDNGTLFAGVSITLGVCLIIGSLFFHYEVRKHHRENGGGKK